MLTLIAFPSSHAAMEAELLAEDEGIACRLIPLPPDIHAGCGLVLRCEQSVSEDIIALLDAHHVALDGVYDEAEGAWRRRQGT